MLARLASFSVRRRRVMVFGIWLPLVIVLSALGGRLATYHTSFTLPNSEAKQVTDMLKSVRGGSGLGGDTAQIVFTATKGTTDPAVKAAMTQMFTDVAALPGLSVTSPYSEQGAQIGRAHV